MTNQTRDNEGRYKRKWGFIKVTKWLFLLTLLAVIGVWALPYTVTFYHNVQLVNHYTASTTTPEEQAAVAAQVKESQIEKRMEEVKTRDSFKAKVAVFSENEARLTATAEYEKAVDDQYTQDKATIEKSKEVVRKAELSF